jgi:uncharacterized damage-inducible protein DinB
MAQGKSSVAAMVVLLAGLVAAAQAQSPTYTKTVSSSWNRVKRLVAASAESMPEANYSFKPTPEVRSFGEIIGHLANEHYMMCSDVKGEKNPQERVDFEKKTTKAELVKALADSSAYCDAAYNAAQDEAKMLQPVKPNRRDTPFGTLLLNVTHDSEHYGNLVTYLRMKGIVPPSSQPTR